MVKSISKIMLFHSRFWDIRDDFFEIVNNSEKNYYLYPKQLKKIDFLSFQLNVRYGNIEHITQKQKALKKYIDKIRNMYYNVDNLILLVLDCYCTAGKTKFPFISNSCAVFLGIWFFHFSAVTVNWRDASAKSVNHHFILQGIVFCPGRRAS